MSGSIVRTDEYSARSGLQLAGRACGPAGQNALPYCTDWGTSPVRAEKQKI